DWEKAGVPIFSAPEQKPWGIYEFIAEDCGAIPTAHSMTPRRRRSKKKPNGTDTKVLSNAMKLFDPHLLVVAALFATSFHARHEPANLPFFWKSSLSDAESAVKEVKNGKVRSLTKSAGGRNIYLVSYGEKPNLNSSA